MSNNNTKLYTVYRILNTVTGKGYIGATKENANRRMTKHLSALNNNNHHNASMQKDFNLYGKNSFSIETIETNITPQSIADKETYYIEKFNAIEHGYNSNHTTGYKVPCVWNGVSYSSIIEAAKDIGISTLALSNRLKKGFSDDNDLKPHSRKPIPIIWNNTEYRSIRAASKAVGVSAHEMKKYILIGFTCDGDVI